MTDSAPTDHDDFGGLGRDLRGFLSRRRALGLLGGAGLAVLTGCGKEDDATTAGPAAAPEPTSSPGRGAPPPGGGTEPSAVAENGIPAETAGPYPGDGSNGPNVLQESGVVRRDITKSVGSASGKAAGIPLQVELTVVDLRAGGAPLEGAAVYLWHCTREGEYSMYSANVAGENYLRGVQVAGSDGRLTFETIFPGCYSGRWPHIHFEVYRDLATATAAGDKMRTSQLALPEDACRQAYAAPGYSGSVRNLEGVSLSSDNVFRDGYSRQLATVDGDATAGYTAKLKVPV